jgi:hypothetical protein
VAALRVYGGTTVTLDGELVLILTIGLLGYSRQSPDFITFIGYSSHRFLYMGKNMGITGLVIVVVAVSSGLTPWQLFQSLCPYFSLQSPQCAILQQQLQPFLQQQVPSTSPQIVSPAQPPITSMSPQIVSPAQPPITSMSPP